nr:hypothetical protein [Tanacetum cinerariifolium]
ASVQRNEQLARRPAGRQRNAGGPSAGNRQECSINRRRPRPQSVHYGLAGYAAVAGGPAARKHRRERLAISQARRG